MLCLGESWNKIESQHVEDTSIDLIVHICYTWPDSFQKNNIVEIEKSDFEIMTGCRVHHDCVSDVRKYTQSLAIVIKRKQYTNIYSQMKAPLHEVEEEAHFFGSKRKSFRDRYLSSDFQDTLSTETKRNDYDREDQCIAPRKM